MSGGGFEAIYRDGTAINGPEPVDTTTVVRWLGDYRPIDEALAWRSLRAREQTPFGRYWSYNSLPKHPRYVNGWSWVTRHGGWLHADGHCILATHGNYLDIRDVCSKDMGGRFVARPWPSDRTGSDLTGGDDTDETGRRVRELGDSLTNRALTVGEVHVESPVLDEVADRASGIACAGGTDDGVVLRGANDPHRQRRLGLPAFVGHLDHHFTLSYQWTAISTGCGFAVALKRLTPRHRQLLGAQLPRALH